MELAHAHGIEIRSVCNGMPSCSECRVRISEGEHNVLPPSRKELSLIGSGYFIDQRRLSCQLRCFGDVVIDLAEQVEKAKTHGAKRPQGPVKKEGHEISLAVTGNLIEQDAQLVDEAKKLSGGNSAESLEIEKGQAFLKPTSEVSTRSEQHGGQQNRGNHPHQRQHQQGRGGGGQNQNRNQQQNSNRNQNRSPHQQNQQGQGRHQGQNPNQQGQNRHQSNQGQNKSQNHRGGQGSQRHRDTGRK